LFIIIIIIKYCIIKTKLNQFLKNNLESFLLMTNSKNLFLIGISSLVLNGCSTIQTPKPQINKIGEDITTVTATAETTATTFKQKNSLKQMCAAPSPDATFNSSDSDSLSIALVNNSKNSSDGLGNSMAEGGNEMNGRSPAVLITRELFYRLCETYTNFNLTKEEALPLFQKVLDLVGQGWTAEAAKTAVSIGPVSNTQQSVVASPVITPNPVSAPSTDPSTSTTTSSP